MHKYDQQIQVHTNTDYILCKCLCMGVIDIDLLYDKCDQDWCTTNKEMIESNISELQIIFPFYFVHMNNKISYLLFIMS